MTLPTDPIAAVTHPDPYPYYAQLVAERSIYHDDDLGLWVAASADAVTSVLTSDLCRVRPATEPVPAALLESPAGEIFRRLVRMTDGERHRTVKQAVTGSLRSADMTDIERLGRRWGATLLDDRSGNLSDFAFALPVHVLGTLLGIPREMLGSVTIWTGEFASCIVPGATPEQIERGKVAAGHLRGLFQDRVTGQQSGANRGLLSALGRRVHQAGLGNSDLVVANAIGFLFQSFDATAGLIGNTLLALASHPDDRASAASDPDRLERVLLEVLRHDPPIQNTRRFVERDGIVAGREMKAGDAILVVLAAANRDPAANPVPERFDAHRRERRSFSFGMGSHACPGDALATTIARTGIQALFGAGLVPDERPETVAYRPSANARIPILISDNRAVRSTVR